MKKHLVRLTAIAGLVAAIASPASAEHNSPELTVRFGPAYVNYNDGYRRSDGYSRYHNYDRHRRKHQKRHRKQHRRQGNAHDRWHWNNDGRWDRYYYYDHSELHHGLRHRHRDSHRRDERHR